MLSVPLRDHLNGFFLEQLQLCTHQLTTASVGIHELASGVQRLPAVRKLQRLAAYLDGLLESGLKVLPYHSQAPLWHGEQCAQLEAEGRRPAFAVNAVCEAVGQIAAIAATNELVMVAATSGICADFQRPADHRLVF